MKCKFDYFYLVIGTYLGINYCSVRYRTVQVHRNKGFIRLYLVIISSGFLNNKKTTYNYIITRTGLTNTFRWF